MINNQFNVNYTLSGLFFYDIYYGVSPHFSRFNILPSGAKNVVALETKANSFDNGGIYVAISGLTTSGGSLSNLDLELKQLTPVIGIDNISDFSK